MQKGDKALRGEAEDIDGHWQFLVTDEDAIQSLGGLVTVYKKDDLSRPRHNSNSGGLVAVGKGELVETYNVRSFKAIKKQPA